MSHLPDNQVSLQDARRVVERARRRVSDFPALQLLIDQYPDDDAEALNLPDRQAEEDAGSEDDLSDDEDLEAIARRLVAARDLLLSPALQAFEPFFIPAEETRSLAAWKFLVLFGFVELLGSFRTHDLAASRDKRLDTLDAARELYKEAVDAATDALAEGDLSRLGWLRVVRTEIKDLHIAAGVAGRGGAWSDMSFSDWGRLGQKIREQYGYADNFARELLTKDFTAGQIKTRLSLYSDAAMSSFSALEIAEVGIDPSVLRFFPGDGTTNCLTRCKCRWSIRILSRTKGNFNATWRLGVAEHCRTCISRARTWRSIKVRDGNLLEPMVPIVKDR